MNDRPIGIFDSGLGGITVLKKLLEKLPSEDYIYLGDTLNFPYGEKSCDEIIEFSRNNIKRLLEYNVKSIIIACGTATSQALECMKNEFDIPIIGIIDPTVKLIKKMQLKKVGVIATVGTIKSGAWEKKLKSEIQDIEVINQACPLLANIAEEGKAKSKESVEAVHNYMKIFKNNSVDNIILGCTHYPIYDKIIRDELKYSVNLINTGDAVAEELEDLLNKNDLKSSVGDCKYKIILTKDEGNFKERANSILFFS